MPDDEQPISPLDELDIAKTLLRMERGVAALRTDFSGRFDKVETRLDGIDERVGGLQRHVYGSKRPGDKIPSQDSMPAVKIPRPGGNSSFTRSSEREAGRETNVTSSAMVVQRPPFTTSEKLALARARNARTGNGPVDPSSEDAGDPGDSGEDAPDTPKATSLVDEIAHAKHLADSADARVDAVAKQASSQDLRGQAHEGRLIAIEQQLEELGKKGEAVKQNGDELLLLQKKQMKTQGVSIPSIPDVPADPDATIRTLTRVAGALKGFAEFLLSREGVKFVMHLTTVVAILYAAIYAAAHGAPPVPWQAPVP